MSNTDGLIRSLSCHLISSSVTLIFIFGVSHKCSQQRTEWLWQKILYLLADNVITTNQLSTSADTCPSLLVPWLYLQAGPAGLPAAYRPVLPPAQHLQQSQSWSAESGRRARGLWGKISVSMLFVKMSQVSLEQRTGFGDTSTVRWFTFKPSNNNFLARSINQNGDVCEQEAVNFLLLLQSWELPQTPDSQIRLVQVFLSNQISHLFTFKLRNIHSSFVKKASLI